MSLATAAGTLSIQLARAMEWLQPDSTRWRRAQWVHAQPPIH